MGFRSDTGAAKAGFEVGDRITRIEDITNPTWEQVELKEALSPGQPLDVEVGTEWPRGWKNRYLSAATGVDQIGWAGWAPKEQTVTITDLVPDKPAEQAGLKEGDQILGLDG